MIWPLASILKQVYTLKIAFWGIDLHQENYGWWWYALNCIVCKWNLSPLFWTWNLAKLKYWYYEMHLTMKNHIIIHSNVFFIIKLGGVCVVEILLEVVKKIGFEAFFILQNVQIFMNLFMISVAKKFRKMGFSVNHLITRILFLQVISHY